MCNDIVKTLNYLRSCTAFYNILILIVSIVPIPVFRELTAVLDSTTGFKAKSKHTLSTYKEIKQLKPHCEFLVGAFRRKRRL